VAEKTAKRPIRANAMLLVIFIEYFFLIRHKYDVSHGNSSDILGHRSDLLGHKTDNCKNEHTILFLKKKAARFGQPFSKA
jgi:hypothetical protein